MKYPCKAQKHVQLESILETLLNQKDHILCSSYFAWKQKLLVFLPFTLIL